MTGAASISSRHSHDHDPRVHSWEFPDVDGPEGLGCVDLSGVPVQTKKRDDRISRLVPVACGASAGDCGVRPVRVYAYQPPEVCEC